MQGKYKIGGQVGAFICKAKTTNQMKAETSFSNNACLQTADTR